MDESRKQFESCFVMRYPRQSSLLQKNHDGNYVFSSTENQWYMWQASREAIEVEFPESAYGQMDAGDAIDAVEVHGLKVKK